MTGSGHWVVSKADDNRLMLLKDGSFGYEFAVIVDTLVQWFTKEEAQTIVDKSNGSLACRELPVIDFSEMITWKGK